MSKKGTVYMNAEIEVYEAVKKFCEDKIARKQALIESKRKKATDDAGQPAEELEQESALSPEEPQPQPLAADHA